MRLPQFAEYVKDHTSMSRRTALMIRKRVVSYYRALYDLTYNKNMLLVFFSSLFAPPVTVAKLATYLLATTILSTGVYAGLAPESFARTSSVVKETVQTVVKKSVKVFIPDSDDTETNGVDRRAGVQQVFCRGEWRDAEDCTPSFLVDDSTGTGGEAHGNDQREDTDEVFCDGERRDLEDCGKRAEKPRKSQSGNVQNTDDHGNDDAREDHGNDEREDVDEVFCDGERRDPEDCAKRVDKSEENLDNDREKVIDSLYDSDDGNSNMRDDEVALSNDGSNDERRDKSNDKNENDEREDANEVFCDGERRDAEDCVERLAKQYDEDNDNDDEDADHIRGKEPDDD